MSLSFVGPRGSFEERWIVYAMLRDNVQHHLEGGNRSDAFARLHAISEALGGASVKVPARALRAEMERAVDLLTRPVDDLAVSMRTKMAIHFMVIPQGATAETEIVKDSMGGVPFLHGSPKTLDDVFGTLVEHLLTITEDASDDDMVEVIDM